MILNAAKTQTLVLSGPTQFCSPCYGLDPRKLCSYDDHVDDDTANRMIDLQAEITALRGAVRLLIQNIYGGDVRTLAIIREEALRGDDLKVYDKEPGDRGNRYRNGVREAVASLLDPFQPDDDEASRLANPAPIKDAPPQ